MVLIIFWSKFSAKKFVVEDVLKMHKKEKQYEYFEWEIVAWKRIF